MDRLISLVPSKLIVIHVEQGKKCFGELTLRNVMHTTPVAYKLLTMNQKRFIINPQSGIIAPLSTIKVEIIYSLSPHKDNPVSIPDYDDCFQLHSVIVPSIMLKTINLLFNTNARAPSEWFTKNNVFIDYGIKVMLVGPQKFVNLISKGKVDDIRQLLVKSDPNWKLVECMDENGQTLLHLAIGQSRLEIVELLLEFGIDIEVHNQSGLSPLEYAVKAREESIVELLLAHKASPERSQTSDMGPIHYASRAGYFEILNMLLLKGARVDALTRSGETAIHLAVAKMRWECVWLLLASGAKTDLQNYSDGKTPLHIASGIGDEQMVKLLIQNGANKYIKDRYGKTAYDIAVTNGFTKLFDALRLGDKLCLAAREGQAREIQRLVKEGALINGLDQNGWTALHRASFKGKMMAVKTLVETGIFVNAKDEEGYTALHCAVEAGNVDVAEYLLKNGADLESKTKNGFTALQISKLLGYSGITKILEHGNKHELFDSKKSCRNKFKCKSGSFPRNSDVY